MSRLALVFERQWIHLLALVALLAGMGWVGRFEAFSAGEWFGLGSASWAWLAIWLAIAHQVLVWLCWRLELHLGLLSSTMGDAGFEIYAVLFSVLGIARVASVWGLAIANQGTIDAPLAVRRVLALLLLVPAIWLFDSVRRHFGFRRAFGADHFDPAVRELGLVDRGIFRYTRNGMYTCGFLILWVPALWFGSFAALWVALMNHLYIWVHFLSTERPDMLRIYAAKG